MGNRKSHRGSERSPRLERRTFWMTDGNIAVGRIEQHGNKFTTFDADGQAVGTFKSVLEAVRATLPCIGSRR
jgi:hypothetical protein